MRPRALRSAPHRAWTPGSHLQAKGAGIPSTDLDADAASGFHFARLGQPTAAFDPSAAVVLRNLSDTPATRSIVHITDGVTIGEATYHNSATAGHARDDLVVTTSTSDDQNTAPLTVVDVGTLLSAQGDVRRRCRPAPTCDRPRFPHSGVSHG